MRTQLGELPGKGSPAEGELLVHRTSAALSRRGRTEVRVRVVVPGSLGWVEVAEGWGANVEAVVHGELADPVINSHFSHLNRMNFEIALKLPARGLWNEIFRPR